MPSHGPHVWVFALLLFTPLGCDKKEESKGPPEEQIAAALKSKSELPKIIESIEAVQAKQRKPEPLTPLTKVPADPKHILAVNVDTSTRRRRRISGG